MAASASKVFISYNQADREWAERIAGADDDSGDRAAQLRSTAAVVR